MCVRGRVADPVRFYPNPDYTLEKKPVPDLDPKNIKYVTDVVSITLNFSFNNFSYDSNKDTLSISCKYICIHIFMSIIFQKSKILPPPIFFLFFHVSWVCRSNKFGGLGGGGNKFFSPSEFFFFFLGEFLFFTP